MYFPAKKFHFFYKYSIPLSERFQTSLKNAHSQLFEDADIRKHFFFFIPYCSVFRPLYYLILFENSYYDSASVPSERELNTSRIPITECLIVVFALINAIM